jgi:hypothetical protein
MAEDAEDQPDDDKAPSDLTLGELRRRAAAGDAEAIARQQKMVATIAPGLEAVSKQVASALGPMQVFDEDLRRKIGGLHSNAAIKFLQNDQAKLLKSFEVPAAARVPQIDHEALRNITINTPEMRTARAVNELIAVAESQAESLDTLARHAELTFERQNIDERVQRRRFWTMFGIGIATFLAAVGSIIATVASAH